MNPTGNPISLNDGPIFPTDNVILTNGLRLIDDEYLSELQREIESLNPGRTISSHSLSMSDVASRHKTRLYQLLSEDHDRIPQRWSLTLSDPRSSHAMDIQRLGESSLSIVAVPTVTSSHRDSAKPPGSIVEDFYPTINPDRCCFSCFDLLGFSPSQTCHDIQQALFRRYDIGDLDQTYNAKMLVVHNNQSTNLMRLSSKDCPVEVAKRLTKQGKTCTIMFERVSSIVLIDNDEKGENVSRSQARNSIPSRLPLPTTKNLPVIPLSPSPTIKKLPLASSSPTIKQLPLAPPIDPSLGALIPQGEIRKSFKVSPEDTVSKVLPEVLKSIRLIPIWGVMPFTSHTRIKSGV